MVAPTDFWPIVRNTAVWWSPIVAGFIGAFGVHLLTQSREREKWILDSKKEEYRELLSALSQAHMSTRGEDLGFANKIEQEQYSETLRNQNNSLRIFTDRIFIASDLPLAKLRISWRDVMYDYSYTGTAWKVGPTETPWTAFDKEYDRIKDVIVSAANRAVPKTAWQRLMFWKD